jgi:chromosome segregation ATPase
MAAREDGPPPEASGDERRPSYLASQLLQLERGLRRTQEEARQMAASLQQTKEMLDGVQRLAHALPALQEEVRLLQTRLMQMERRHDQALTLASDVLRQRRTDLEQFHQVTSGLLQRVEALEARTTALEELGRTLEGLARRLDDAFSQLQLGVENSGARFQDGLARLQQQVERLLSLEESLSRAHGTLVQLQEKQDALAARFQVQQSAIQDAVQQVQRMEGRLEQLQTGREDWRQLRADVERLSQHLAVLEGTLERQTAEREEQGRHLDLLAQRVQEQAQGLMLLSQEVEEHRQRFRQALRQVLQLLERQRRRQQDVLRQEVQEIRGGMEQLEQ